MVPGADQATDGLAAVFAVKTYFPALVIQQGATLAGVDDRRERAVSEEPVLTGMRQRDDGGAVADRRKTRTA